jgi:putative heme-binding domain-containing protein
VPAAENSDQRKPRRDWFSSQPKLIDPHDRSATLAERARSYLHVNCAHCHRFGGGGSAKIELGFDKNLEDAKVVNLPPTQGTFGITDAAIVKPGEPFRSLLYYRMAKTGSGHMPHLGAELIDERGLALIHDWIRSMSPRPEDDTQLLAQLQAVARADTEKRAKVIDELLGSTSAALALSHAVSARQFSGELTGLVVMAGAKHSNAAVRDLFERFLPDEQRSGRLGHRIRPRDVLDLKGDVQRGKELFFGTTNLQCKTCHRAHNEGGRVGPELSAIGKKLSREQILESLAEPSKVIAQEFRTQLLETGDGRTFTGIVVSRTEREVVIRDAQDKETRLMIGEIEQTIPQPQSMMPEGLLRDLTPQQAADLVEYLYSLK